MSFEKKKEAALQELEGSGIWKSNYMPPALIVCWKLGFKVKPPHYNRFIQNALPLGLWFCVAWGVLMWFMQWRSLAVSIPMAIGFSLAAGFLFGFSMAVYYRWSARKHRLSHWNDLPAEGESA